MKDRAIDVMNKEDDKFFAELRASDSYKFGYCRSVINLALWHLNKGRKKEAVKALKDCSEMMRDKPNG
jgi:hypothetical protein